MLTVYFAHPLILLLLLLLPLLLWRQLSQKLNAVRFSDASLVRGLPRGRSRRVRWAGVLFRIIALALLIVALAGPRWPDEGSRIPTSGIAIGIVLDASKSMEQEDFQWKGKTVSRFQAVKNVFKLFVAGDGDGKFAGRGHDRISLVVFATRPETVCPLTLSHSVLLELLDKQEVRSIPTEADTNIGDGIAWGLNGLIKSESGKKVLVVLTDGEHTVPPPALKPRQAAQLAGNLQIPIYVIDAGKEPPQAAPDYDKRKKNRDLAKKILQDVAEISGGKYFPANDTQALLEVCRQIDAIERRKIESYEYLRYHQGFAWFALGSFVFLWGILTLEQTLWRRTP